MAPRGAGQQSGMRRSSRRAVLPLALASAALAGSAAFVAPRVGAWRPSGGQAATARTAWQQRLDEALLDLDRAPEERLESLREALQDPAAIVRDVGKAVGAVAEKGLRKGHPEALDALWPKGTMARADLEGLVALGKQLPEVLEDFRSSESPPFQGAGGQAPAGTGGDVTQTLPSLLDAEKREEILEEVMNVFRRTPRGLEEPEYSVVRELEKGVELRRYKPFSVAQRAMPDDSGKAYSSAEGFLSLAGYLFGDNSDKTAMAMTMPVEMSFGAGDGRASMSFVLPKAYSGAAPAPNDASVQLVEIPGRLAAVKAFAGVATAGEVDRQRRDLEEVLMEEGLEPLDKEAYSVLQYNPPYTLPWRRRNELAIVVEEPVAPEEPEVTGDEVAEKEAPAPSVAASTDALPASTGAAGAAEPATEESGVAS